jgi:hypothetical protein
VKSFLMARFTAGMVVLYLPGSLDTIGKKIVTIWKSELQSRGKLLS